MKSVVFYHCKHCGNLAARILSGGGAISCCGQSMDKLSAGQGDPSVSKYVPVPFMQNGHLKVVVGSDLAPMTDENYVEWIALQTEDRLDIVHLHLGDLPQAVFSYEPVIGSEEIFTGENDDIVPNCEGNPCNFVLKEQEVKAAMVYAYCGENGLWMAKL